MVVDVKKQTAAFANKLHRRKIKHSKSLASFVIRNYDLYLDEGWHASINKFKAFGFRYKNTEEGKVYQVLEPLVELGYLEFKTEPGLGRFYKATSVLKANTLASIDLVNEIVQPLKDELKALRIENIMLKNMIKVLQQNADKGDISEEINPNFRT